LVTTRNLNRLLAPQSVAVIGASPRLGSVGNTVLTNLAAAGTGLQVVAVNPKHQEIGGIPCVAKLEALQQQVDLAAICIPAAGVPQVVRECGQANIPGVLIFSAGFREAGTTGKILEEQLAAEAARFPEMRILGPNCLGFMAPHRGLNASFVREMPPRGNVAFVAQSGALCSSVLDWAQQQNVGFSYFVSLGNMLDVGAPDLIDFLAADPHTESIILYVESIPQARAFMSAARAFSRNKPIIAYKAGRFAESAQAAASHTGALAGVDAVYEAAFARAGVVRVFEIEDLFDCAQLLARQPKPPGPRLAIVTNAGGPGVMATDALLAKRGTLAQLSPATLEKLNALLPAAWSHGNPIDVLGDAPPERLCAATQVALAAPEIDGALVILSPQAMTDPTGTAERIIALAKQSSKPVITSWMGGSHVARGRELFAQAGVPTYTSPEKGIRAFSYLVSYARRRDMLYETPREMPVTLSPDRAKQRAVFHSALARGETLLSENASKDLLEAYGIPVAKTIIARARDEVAAKAREIGFPVALKILSPDITHKSEVGGVELGLASEAAVHDAYDRILRRAAEARPDARLIGVTVQQMLRDPNGRELIIGAKRDPVFGAVLLVGSGGIAAEVLQDYALELPPLSEPLAARMLESLRIWPLLKEFRGKPAVDLDRLIEVLMRFSYIIAENPQIAELDVNPLLATPTGATALDARIVLDPEALTRPSRPYSHLAIRPYPDEYVKQVTLADGTLLLLRPIRPEDEIRWHELLGSCSRETLHRRFRYMFKSTTHEMATRFCYIDYDRELALVAEIETGSGRKIAGVSRLIADADHTNAEFAILVADPYQSRGIGTQLMNHCQEICKQWGIRRVVAETASDNDRMLGMFRHRGFSLKAEGDTVRVAKDLT
jgi:acetyltransferase